MVYQYDVDHRPGMSPQAAAALSKFRKDQDDTEPLQHEVPSMVTDTTIETDNQYTVAMVVWDSREEIIIMDWPQNKPKRIVLPSVL